MPLETVSSQSGEILSLADFKRELGIWDGADDQRARLLLESARDYCERWSERTLRLSATRTYATCEWPSDGWVLRHPPVLSLTSITYYDSDNASQTLSSSYYSTTITAEGFAHVEFTPSAVLPSLYDRQDAVAVTYATGYSSADAAPAAAKYAIVLAAKAALDVSDVRASERMEHAAKNMLSTVSAPTYA